MCVDNKVAMLAIDKLMELEGLKKQNDSEQRTLKIMSSVLTAITDAHLEHIKDPDLIKKIHESIAAQVKEIYLIPDEPDMEGKPPVEYRI